MTRIICALSIVLLVSACAKRPGSIKPTTIPVSAYSNLSCKVLTAELAKEKETLTNLEDSQRQAANADAIGVFLFGVPFASVTNGDQEGAVSVSKGKVQAMESARSSKSC